MKKICMYTLAIVVILGQPLMLAGRGGGGGHGGGGHGGGHGGARSHSQGSHHSGSHSSSGHHGGGHGGHGGHHGGYGRGYGGFYGGFFGGLLVGGMLGAAWWSRPAAPMYYGGTWGGYPYYWGQVPSPEAPEDKSKIVTVVIVFKDKQPYVINEDRELVPFKEAFPDTPADQIPTYDDMQQAATEKKTIPHELLPAAPDATEAPKRRTTKKYTDAKRDTRFKDTTRVVIADDDDRDALAIAA